MTTINKDVFEVVVGDYGEPLTAILGGTTNLTGNVTGVADVWPASLGDLTAAADAATELPVTITDPTARTIAIDVGDSNGWLAELTAGNTFHCTVQLDWAGAARRLTWPSRGYATIIATQRGQ